MPRDNDPTRSAANPSPEERHREFSEQNGRWNKEMEDAFSELDELAEGEPESAGSSKGEPTPA